MDPLGDAVLEQGLVAAVLCQLLLQMAYFSPVSLFARPLGDAGVFVFVQCSWKQTTMYLFRTSTIVDLESSLL